MRGRDHLLSVTVGVVRFARVMNVVLAVLLVTALAATFPLDAAIVARLSAKYGATADIGAIIWFARAILLLTLPAAFVVERLFRALRAILVSVRAGTPFTPANASRVRTIGWMLLALQLLDLFFGIVTLIAARLHIDFTTWQPSITGWLGVLVAFVLARVFAAGTALDDDLAGTV